jgi:Amt family ammonium transporter
MNAGGSELAANARAAIALMNTNLAACFGGLAWVLMEYRKRRLRLNCMISLIQP